MRRALNRVTPSRAPRHEKAEDARKHGKDDDCRDDYRDFRGYPKREDCSKDRSRRTADDHAGRQGHVELDHAAVFGWLFLRRAEVLFAWIVVSHVEPFLATPQAMT